MAYGLNASSCNPLTYKTILVELQQLIDFKWAMHKKLVGATTYLECLSNANLFTHFSYGYLINLPQGN